MRLRIHYLQNLETAGIGNVVSWASEKGYPLTGTKLYAGEPLPPSDAFDILIVLGGNPEECTAWLDDEIAYIRQVVLAGKGVVGICLGSQLLACAMGGKLIPNTYAESGWLPVEFKEQTPTHPLLAGTSSRELFFFHKNTVVLPESFVLHASTVGCPNQIFTYQDRAIGIQSHPEMVPETIMNLARDKRGNLAEGPYHKVDIKDAENETNLAGAQALLGQILDNLSTELCGIK